jgi:hypothetical protein
MRLFLLGAGFNVDVGRLETPYRTECFYPLVSDVARICFGIDFPSIPTGQSIEDLFLAARHQHDDGPMKRLTDRLMEADNYLAWRLAAPGELNSYQAFFESFSRANFLTFNYDSLVEMFLFRAKRWYPEDGYGLHVTADVISPGILPEHRTSTCKILHLHGSHCLRFSDFEIHQQAGDRFPNLSLLGRPTFKFDPDCLSPLFFPYRRILPDAGYRTTHNRVVAPVPDKASELEQPFIREVYNVAHSLVRESGELVAIGYSFSPHDQSSYDSLLRVLAASSERRLVLVSPEAGAVAARIGAQFQTLRIEPIETTFKSWAADSFRTIGTLRAKL